MPGRAAVACVPPATIAIAWILNRYVVLGAGRPAKMLNVNQTTLPNASFQPPDPSAKIGLCRVVSNHMDPSGGAPAGRFAVGPRPTIHAFPGNKPATLACGEPMATSVRSA